VINSKAYKVKILIHMLNAGVTPIFYPWKLYLALNNLLPGQVADPEPLVIVTNPGDPEGHEEWDVREIVNCRVYHNHHQYKAIFNSPWDKWNANPPWQPWTDFKNTCDKILAYH
jgi:hypothetical protein